VIISISTRPTSAPIQTKLAYAFRCAGIDIKDAYVIYSGDNLEIEQYITINRSTISGILVCGIKSLLMWKGKRNLSRKDGDIEYFDSLPVMYTYSISEVNMNRDYMYNATNHMQYFKLLCEGKTLKLITKYNFNLSEWPLAKVKELLLRTTHIAYDIESTGLDPFKEALTMIGLAGKLTNGEYWTGIISPAGGFYALYPQTSRADWEQMTAHFPLNVYAHHSRFDNRFLSVHNFYPPIIGLDTMHAAHNENELQTKKLKHLLRAKLGAEPYETEIDFSRSKTMTFSEVSDYCRKDCIGTLWLAEWYINEKFPVQGALGPHLPPNSRTKQIMDYSMNVERLLQRIEARGVYVDPIKLDDAKHQLTESAEAIDITLQEVAHKHGHEKMNFGSPAQVQRLLYTDMGLPVVYRDEVILDDEEDDAEAYVENKHVATTNAAALKKLAHKWVEVCTDILESRKLNKMLNGFILPWEDKLRYDTRLHTAYHSARTRTFRLSSSDPNLQQVSRDALVRNLIAVPPGKVFIEADHSQIELRVASIVGDILSMQDVYKLGGDIHTNTARAIARLLGIDYASLSKVDQKLYRTRAKAVNFGFLYGMSARGFMEYAAASYDLYITLKEAEDFRILYFTLYPELILWHQRVKRMAAKGGVATIATGRVRHVPNVNSNNQYLKGRALRQAINTPVQGLASEIMLIGMLELDFRLSMLNMVSQHAVEIGQCHDAVFIECEDDPEKIDTVCNAINSCLTGVTSHQLLKDVHWAVPLEVEIKVGKCWGDPLAEVWKKSS
jgi:DNA polymerase-1